MLLLHMADEYERIIPYFAQKSRKAISTVNIYHQESFFLPVLDNLQDHGDHEQEVGVDGHLLGGYMGPGFDGLGWVK